jgi:hypothetical protein
MRTSNESVMKSCTSAYQLTHITTHLHRLVRSAAISYFFARSARRVARSTTRRLISSASAALAKWNKRSNPCALPRRSTKRRRMLELSTCAVRKVNSHSFASALRSTEKRPPSPEVRSPYRQAHVSTPRVTSKGADVSALCGCSGSASTTERCCWSSTSTAPKGYDASPARLLALIPTGGAATSELGVYG